MINAFTANVLAGKVVLVAGGSSGINLGIAQRLAQAGARLTLVSRSEERIQAAAASITSTGAEAIGIAADVRDYAAIEGAFAIARETFGEVDIVISGAAGNFRASALELSANAFKTVVDIDLIGTFNVFRAAYAFLRKPGASLIAISAPGAVHPATFQMHACAAKAGINMLVKCLAMEWGPAGVRVNGISPGPIADTEGMARLTPTAEMEARYKSQLALRDYGTKQDIADAALFLCTDSARYITGTILDCDGGRGLGDASADALQVPRQGRPAETAPR
jgi:NAD(P)-dependent dehydrogenase (short-subunit alcohol dehydrogenase family)